MLNRRKKENQNYWRWLNGPENIKKRNTGIVTVVLTMNRSADLMFFPDV